MKEEISRNYMDRMKEQHGGKGYPEKRSAIITGVSENNIGKAIVNELVNCTFSCKIFDVDNCDVRVDSHLFDIINDAEIPDTMILCHGYTHLDWIEDQPITSIEDAVTINMLSHMKLIKLFADRSVDLPYRKTIIVIGSMAANAVLNGSAPYCAAKAGLQHFIKCVAWELAPKAFDIYIINPSNVEDTPMTEHTIRELAGYRDISLDEAAAYWASSNPRGKFLTKKEIARLVSALACSEFPYLSGTPLNLTGGQR